MKSILTPVLPFAAPLSTWPIARIFFAAVAAMMLLPGSVAAQATDLVTVQSAHAFAPTLERLESALTAKGMKIFARIDHAAAARDAGLSMPSTTVLIFGNPKGGTPLMLAQPTVALDLPLKALIREDAQGKVWLTWRKADALTAHGLSAEQVAPLQGVGKLLEATVR